MDEDLLHNQNRARIEKAGVRNRMTPANATAAPRNVADGAGKEMPPGILGPNGMMKDAHAGGRHSGLQNLSVKPGEKSREKYAEEIRRRLANPGNPTDKYR
jgi:hypothetical protein